MKKFKTFSILIMCFVLLFSTTSCVVLARTDNGNHKGWYKNSNNPHHPASTNPVNSKGKSKK